MAHPFDKLKAAMTAAGHVLSEGEGILIHEYDQVKGFLSKIGLGHIGTNFHLFDSELAKLEHGGHNLVHVGEQAGEELIDASKSLFDRSIAGVESLDPFSFGGAPVATTVTEAPAPAPEPAPAPAPVEAPAPAPAPEPAPAPAPQAPVAEEDPVESEAEMPAESETPAEAPADAPAPAPQAPAAE